MSAPVITEADILNEVVAPDQPGLSKEAARSILSLGFTESAQKRISKLLEANNSGNLGSEEREELDKYLRVGQFLDLLQAKARVSLAQLNRP